MTKALFTGIICTAFALTSCSSALSGSLSGNTGSVNLTDLSYTGSGIFISDNNVRITGGGAYTISGTLSDGMIYVDTERNVELILNGASITNSKGPAIFIDNAEKAVITLADGTKNTLSDGTEYSMDDADGAVFSNDNLEIMGGGTLTIKANFDHGIAGDDSVIVTGGNISINSKNHGFKVNDLLQIDGGGITVVSETGKGMKAEEELIINGGDINLTSLESEGLESKGKLTVNGGNISIDAFDDGINAGSSDSSAEETQSTEAVRTTADTQNESTEETPRTPEIPDRKVSGIAPQGERPQGEGRTPPENFENMTPPEMPEGKMPQGGDFGGNMGGFSHIDEETAAEHAITINGGSIYIKSGGDGIDSNGNLTINGGTITIEGPTSDGDGPLDSDGEMKITGGTVTTLSSAGMLQIPQSRDGQNIMRITFDEKQSTGTEIKIVDMENGEELLSITSTIDFQALVFTSDALQDGKKYTVYTNGVSYIETTLEELGGTGRPKGGMGSFGGTRGQRPDISAKDNTQET